jgi:mono/diheme cytochrome c family protein
MRIVLLGASLHCAGSSEDSPPAPDAVSASVVGIEAPPAPADAPPAPAPADAGAFGFQRDIYPLFVTYCGQCHSVNGPYHDIASPDMATAYADAVEYADRIVARIAQGNMPPGCVFDEAACVPSAAQLAIERWLDEGLPP